jgi:hypothetical protein
MISIRSGSTRVPLAPLAALFALAVLAMAWIASSSICARPIVVHLTGAASSATMPMDMSGMDMSGMDMSHMDMSHMDMAGDMGAMPMMKTPAGSVMICPVVLGLIGISTLLAGWALIAAWRDRDRTLTLAVLVRALARLPVLRTFAALSLAGGLAIAAIVAVDGGTTFSLSLGVMLAFVLSGISIAATLCSLVAARAIVALCARLIVVIVGAIAERRTAARFARSLRRRPLHAPVVALAFGRGLRAPPLPAH